MNKDLQTEKKHNKILIIGFIADVLLFIFAIIMKTYDVLKSPFRGLPGVQLRGSSGSFWRVLMIICGIVFIILVILLMYWKSYAILGVKTVVNSKAEMARNGIVIINKSTSNEAKSHVVGTKDSTENVKVKNDGQNMELF